MLSLVSWKLFENGGGGEHTVYVESTSMDGN